MTDRDAADERHPEPEDVRAALDAEREQGRIGRVPPSGVAETAELARRVTAAPGATLELDVRPEEVHAVLAALWEAVGEAPCEAAHVSCDDVPQTCEQRGRVERVLARLARAHGLTLPAVDPDAA